MRLARTAALDPMKPATTLYERIRAASAAAVERLDAEGIEAAVILGSGLATVCDRVADARSAGFAALPGFPEPTVAGHPGRLVTGTIAGRKALLLCGRVHGYEGYPAAEVGFAVRVAAALGAHTLIVTNASGGIEPTFDPGEIVAISDHVNLTGESPLKGENDERLGPRFVDLSGAYSPRLRALAQECAPAALGRPLREAVYAGMAGPSYETPAEVRMLRALGAGLVGMSTVHEVVTARHAGLEVLGLALVANHAAGVGPHPLRHEDVTVAAAAGASHLGALVASVIERMPAQAR